MNHNRRVVHFTLTAVCVLLLFSVLPHYVSGLAPLRLDKVSVISDVVKPPARAGTPPSPATPGKTATAPLPAADASLLSRYYSSPGSMLHFRPDTAAPALRRFSAALAELRKGKKRKVRIAWFGDSLIEGDNMTKTVRRMLQESFGGAGVGFVSVQSADAPFRSTVKHSWSGGWTGQTWKDKATDAPVHPSGHVFYGPGALHLEDRSTGDTGIALFRTLLCGFSREQLRLRVNGAEQTAAAPQLFNRIVLDSSRSRAIDLEVLNAGAPVYGVSIEGESGVVLDNFSFRGVTGLELTKLDPAFLRSMTATQPYDLVVLEYGTNVLYNPDQVAQDWYYGKMKPVLKHIRSALPEADLLVVSTSDRAFRYDGQWKSALAMDTLVKVQAQLALDVNAAFFNLYQSMGGEGTIVRWAEGTPALANRDYIHPNEAGAQWLGGLFYEAMVRDGKKEGL
jgi:lysophospholipase L1-like esterase